MSARVIPFPERIPGTSITIIGQAARFVLMRAPSPDGRQRTVRGRPPAGVSLQALHRAGRDGRLSFSGPWWNQEIEVAPPAPKSPGRF